MQSIVCRCHETINRRFKQFGVLKKVYRHDIRDHGKMFRSVAVVIQLCIQNGEPLFDVDYTDPHLDDNYYPEPAEDDNP